MKRKEWERERRGGVREREIKVEMRREGRVREGKNREGALSLF